MELWQALVLGIVEGVTEYLPISSTGHLVLASALMGLDRPEIKASVDAFNIVIQGGAILAVVLLYWRRLLGIVRGLLGRDPAGLRLGLSLAVAFLPAAVLGLMFDDWIEARLFYPGPVVGALVVGGVYMIVLDRAFARRRSATPEEQGRTLGQVTLRDGLIIGIMQCAALWPGTSRSMMTITGAMLAGLRPVAAAEYSFLLGLLTLSAASGYTLVKNLAGSGEAHANLFQQLGVAPVVVGLLAATASAALAVQWLVGFLQRHGLTPFGVYRIALGGVMLGLVWAGVVRW